MRAKSFTAFGLILTLTLLAGALSALSQEPQRCTDGNSPPSQQQVPNVVLEGQLGGATSTVAIQGQHGTIGVGPRLVMLDISDLAHPVFVGQADPLPGAVPPRHIDPVPGNNTFDDPPVYDESSFLPLVYKLFAPRFTWYVDSVNGHDANDGKSPSTAFQTLAALQAAGIATGDKIALARGSHWREQLTITADAVTVDAYGTGDRPLLDASNIIANASFSRTAGQTNVYQISITPEWNGLGKDWVNVWENDAFLTRASSEANCDATAGSYYPSSEGSGTITLYVHASDSSDVTANGKTYEYTHRKFGLDTRNATGVTLRNLHTRRNLHADGSLRLGPFGSVYDTYCDDGSAHNILFEAGAYLNNVEARNAYHTGSFSMFVGNSDTPAGEGLTLVDCKASLDVYDADAVGFYCHHNVSGSFGAISLVGCSAVNLGLGYTMTDGDSYALTRCTSVGTRTFMRDGSTNPYTVTDCEYAYTGSSGRVLDGQAAGTRAFTQFTAVVSDPGSGLFYSAQAIDLILTDCDLTNNDTSAALANFVYLANAGATLTATGNAYKSPNLPNGPYVYFFPNDLATLDSDDNCFGDADQWFMVGAGDYGTVAAYQAGTRQDATNTVGNCP